MATPRPVVGNVWRISQLLTNGIFSWRESYWWAKSAGTLTDALVAARRLGFNRWQCLATTAAIVSVSLRQVRPAGGGQLFQTDTAGCGPGQADGPSQAAWNDVTYNLYDPSNTYRHGGVIRAIPIGGALWKGHVAPSFVSVNLEQMVNGFIRFIGNAQTETGGVFCAKGRSKDATVTRPTRILSLAGNPDGCNTDVTLATQSPFPDGSTVHLHGLAACGASHLNGDRLALKSTGAVVTVKGHPGACNPAAVGPNGQMSLVSLDWYPLASPVAVLGNVYGYFSAHKLGSKQGKTRGAARKRKC